MKRPTVVLISAAFALLAAVMVSRFARSLASTGKAPQEGNQPSAIVLNPLQPPHTGRIPVAFVISEGAVVIDFAGPWEVFQDVSIPSRGRTMDEQVPFRLYTVAESMAPVRTSGGMMIRPNYTFADAPRPKIIVIPAQAHSSAAMLRWIRTASKNADLTMSVCTGSFILAKTGLLSGKAATTHHSSYRQFELEFPDLHVKRGARFVEDGNLATSGGLSSGIDLALRVVERYFGRQVAADTAYEMEYQGQGWMNPNSNSVYAQTQESTAEHPLCPICGMEVDPATASSSVYRGKKYYFCSTAHKAAFDAAPEKWK